MSDNVPSSSYSDPVYDRLDDAARAVRRHWLLVAGSIALVVIAAVSVRWVMSHHPEAGSAAGFIAAQQQSDQDKALAAYQAVADDVKTTPFFRARARIEMAQIQLDRKDTATALQTAQVALQDAQGAESPELVATARLTVAAVQFQAADLEGAGTSYTRAISEAGARNQVQFIEAKLGAARVAEAQGRMDEALSQLDDLINRSDIGADTLLSVARSRYWRVKRLIAERAAAPAASATTAAKQ